jgi:hypothetical protein
MNSLRTVGEVTKALRLSQSFTCVRFVIGPVISCSPKLLCFYVKFLLCCKVGYKAAILLCLFLLLAIVYWGGHLHGRSSLARSDLLTSDPMDDPQALSLDRQAI